jgi:hypothetical protein
LPNLVENAPISRESNPVTTTSSRVPGGSRKISAPASVKPGAFYLRALNGHGDYAAQSVVFDVG